MYEGGALIIVCRMGEGEKWWGWGEEVGWWYWTLKMSIYETKHPHPKHRRGV